MGKGGRDKGMEKDKGEQMIKTTDFEIVRFSREKSQDPMFILVKSLLFVNEFVFC